METNGFIHFDIGRKVLATAVLLVIALGFCLGYLNIIITYASADAVAGLSLSDLKAVYAEPRFAVMVRGPMAENAGEDGAQLIDWAMRGGPKAEYVTTIRAIMVERDCSRCHNGFEEPSLATYDAIAPLLEPGLPIRRLGGLSHAHLFGIGMALSVVSYLFCFTPVGSRLKAVFIATAFTALVCDIGSWWGAKFISPHFVYLTIAAGVALMGCVAVMTLSSLASLWRARRN